MKASRADPRPRTRCQRGGPFGSFAALRRRRRSLSPSSRPVARTNAITSAIPPKTKSSAGLRVFCAVLTPLEPSQLKTIRRPSVMLVIAAPSR